MKAKFAPIIAAEKATWAPAQGEPPQLKETFEPIAGRFRPHLRRHRLPVGLVVGEETFVLGLPQSHRAHAREGDGKYRYGFRIAPELVRTVLRDDEPDWVNTIFLSTRFTTWRVGGYNEFSTPSSAPHRGAHPLRRRLVRRGPRRLRVDLQGRLGNAAPLPARRRPTWRSSASSRGDKLTCNLHGWQWDLASGRCPTSKGHGSGREARHRG